MPDCREFWLRTFWSVPFALCESRGGDLRSTEEPADAEDDSIPSDAELGEVGKLTVILRNAFA